MMKKWWALLCCVSALLMLLTACGEEEDDKISGITGDNTRKIGMAAIASRVMDGMEKTTVKATVAAVVLDKDGKIEQCRLDEVEFDVKLSGGKPQDVTDLASKTEKGDAYLLTERDRGVSSDATASWAAQVAKFCAWTKGKTGAMVSGVAATDGKSSEIEGCDLIVTDFIKAVRKAADTARERNIAATDRLSLAITTEKSANATDEAPEYDVEMTAVTVNGAGKVSACVADTLQGKMTVAEGMFTSISGEIETKRDMGDAYKMRAASGIKKEWYEQAAAFDVYVVGKTAQQLSGVKLDSEGKTDAIAGCTVMVSGMLKNAVKAVKAA